MARITVSDLERLATELAHLARSGAPLPDGLRFFAESVRSGKLKAVSAETAAAMQRGQSLSQSLESSSVQVPPEFINLVRCGEQSGDLDSILVFAAEQVRRSKSHRAAMVTAMTYPLFVLLATFVILYFLGNFIAPKFVEPAQGIFAQLGATELPPMTAFFFGMMEVFRGKSGQALCVLVGALIVLMFVPSVRDALYRLMLRLPGLRKLLQLSDTTVVMHTLSSMLSRGVPINESLRTAKLAVWGADYRQSLEEMAEAADQGHSTAGPLEKQAPPTAAWLYGEGERSGNLPEACKGIAEYCEDWFQRISVRSIAIIEPLLVVILGVFIGFIIISAYLPLFTIPKVLGAS